MSPRSNAVARIARAAPLFAALGDETRLALVLRLCAEGPQSITRLTEGAAVTRQAVTKHLDVLESAGLVRGERRGRERIWDLDAARLDEARAYLDQMSRRWDDALARLQKLVEQE
jgi:DNA-binding transcriptional ArsR family regulator